MPSATSRFPAIFQEFSPFSALIFELGNPKVKGKHQKQDGTRKAFWEFLKNL